MCGIAGLNCSPAFADEHLSEEVLAEIVKEGWLFNLHRGKDALGYFRQDSVEGKTQLWKREGSADEFLKENEFTNVKKANILGIHTRAASVQSGDPALNENNHPVAYGRVAVTHNGYINNHEQIRRSLSAEDRAELPEVDTVAIPIVLDQVGEHPEEGFALYGSAIAELHGNMAVHAVFYDYPGYSLLFRKGGNPMIMAYSQTLQCLVYASEETGIWGVINAMGLDPRDATWSWKRMDQDVVMLFKDGKPVKWGKVPHTPKLTDLTAHFLRRILPGAKKNRVAYITDTKSHWSQSFIPFSEQILDKKRLVYERGIIKEKDIKFPLANPNLSHAAFSEASEIWWGNDDYLHIFVDDDKTVEVIVEPKTMVIRDIFNYKDLGDTPRITKTPKSGNKRLLETEPLKDSDLTFAESYYMNKNVSHIGEALIPGKNGTPKYPFVPYSESKTTAQETSVVPFTGRGSFVGTKQLQLAVGKGPGQLAVAGRNQFIPSETVTYNGLGDLFWTKTGLVFLRDDKCEEHDVYYTAHDAVNTPIKNMCSEVWFEFLKTLASLESVELYEFMLPGRFEWEQDEDEHKSCGINNHKFEVVDTLMFLYENMLVSVPVSEICRECTTMNEITVMPRELAMMTHGPIKDLEVILAG